MVFEKIKEALITHAGVEADKITMLMNPKKFEAEGNVKTNIEQDSTNNKKDNYSG